MEENLQENKFLVIMKRIWPTVLRIINIIVYGILNFIKTSVKYIIDQINNSY